MSTKNKTLTVGEKHNKAANGELFRIAAFIIIFSFLVAVFYALLLFLNVNRDYASWLTAVVVLVFGIMLSALIARAIRDYIRNNGVMQEAGTISRLFSIIAYTTVAIIALYLMHINVTGLLISAGFLGIVLGLAAQSTLSNVFSGISMIIAKPFEPGDYITVQTWQYSRMPSTYPHEEFIPGYNGTVNKIGLLYTEIIENNIPLYVPNSILNQALVINHRRSETRTLRLRVELASDVSFIHLKKVIKDVLKRHDIYRGVSIQIEHISQNAYGVSVTYTANAEKGSGPIDQRIRGAVMEEVLSFINKHRKQAK
jgi:small conductance mechanosensitive channel